MPNKPLTLVLHGGAGTILRSEMTPDKERDYTEALGRALDRGYAVLENGASALDAVETAVRELEDCPLFNAGRGSVFTATGGHEMDACIMDGRERQAGAVSLVRNIRNPVSLARLVMEKSGHVFLAGEGAEEFARQQGCKTEPSAYFHDDFRYEQWRQVAGSETVQLDHSASRNPDSAGPKTDKTKDHKFGTVGAAALDAQGNLAAATSTGGMTNKRFGRIGDSPVVGAGNFADNQTCAVSCTGSGEYFLRGVVAYDVACLMEHKGMSLPDACREVVQHRLLRLGGDGGLIAVDAQGNFALEFNTEGMYRAVRTRAGLRQILIYGS
ncbi:MAG: beta-aspartyl-peptidase [Bacteroidetes bacterium]|nr:beta-aspartyl-peptidase [Bacteroidota bacterium]